jgi:hypothetical protein
VFSSSGAQVLSVRALQLKVHSAQITLPGASIYERLHVYIIYIYMCKSRDSSVL